MIRRGRALDSLWRVCLFSPRSKTKCSPCSTPFSLRRRVLAGTLGPCGRGRKRCRSHDRVRAHLRLDHLLSSRRVSPYEGMPSGLCRKKGAPWSAGATEDASFWVLALKDRYPLSIGANLVRYGVVWGCTIPLGTAVVLQSTQKSKQMILVGGAFFFHRVFIKKDMFFHDIMVLG